MQETIEFSTITALVALLEVELEKYTKKEFSYIPKIDELTPETLVATLTAIIATPEAQKTLAPKGYFMGAVDTVWSWGPTSVKYHRLPHLLYFAEKAKEIKDLSQKLLGYAQLNPVMISVNTTKEIIATAVLLNSSLDELFKSTKTLSDASYKTEVTVTVNTKTRNLFGMKGGTGSSELSMALTQIIVGRYEKHLESMKTHVTQKGQQLVQNKTTDKNHTLDAFTSTTFKMLQERLPVVENNALHFAILANDPAEVEKCINHFDVNELNRVGLSPLYLAIFDNNTPYKLRDDLNIAIVRLLLENGANANENFGDRCRCSFLHAAIFQRTSIEKYPYQLRGMKKINMELIRLLITHHARLDAIPEDEPKIHVIPRPNIPGIIADKNNKTPLAELLRSAIKVDPAPANAQREKYQPPIIKMTI